MCWSAVLNNARVAIATEDIKVYKIVKLADEEKCVSAFQDFTYEVCETPPIIALQPDYFESSSGNTGWLDIITGYHSYASIAPIFNSIEISQFTGVKVKYWRLGKKSTRIPINNREYIATFIIPKGSIYFINSDNYIVSNKIKYTGKFVKM